MARNPSGKTRTRLMAVILHPRDTKNPTIRENGEKVREIRRSAAAVERTAAK